MTEQTKDRKNVAIIGAGMTGLSAAYHLQQAGHSAVVFENSDRIGGILQTSMIDGFRCEHGPNTLMVNDRRVQDFIHAIGLNPRTVVANKQANKRFVIHDRKLKALPGSPIQFLSSPLFSLSAKLKVLKEPFLAKAKSNAKSESFADFVRRRLGPEILEKAAGPFVSGIYAGDPSRLATKHAFPNIYRCEDEQGSIFKGLMNASKKAKKGLSNRLRKREIISFQNGMEELPNATAAMLDEDSVFTNAQIGGISYNKQTKRWQMDWKCGKSVGMGSFSDIILTVPAHKLSELPLEDSLLESISSLSGIDYPPVTSMVLGFKREQINHPLDGFGMLNATTEKSKMLGALFTSTLFEGRAPAEHVAINVMLGGAITPEHASMTDSAMKASVMDELRLLLFLEDWRSERWAKKALKRD